MRDSATTPVKYQAVVSPTCGVNISTVDMTDSSLARLNGQLEGWYVGPRRETKAEAIEDARKVVNSHRLRAVEKLHFAEMGMRAIAELLRESEPVLVIDNQVHEEFEEALCDE